MDFNEYQKETTKLRFHEEKSQLNSMTIWALGIAGEGGEVADIIKKINRGDFTIKEKEEDLKKELGDVLWYLSQMAQDLGVDFADIARLNLDKLNSRVKRGTQRGDGDNR